MKEIMEKLVRDKVQSRLLTEALQNLVPQKVNLVIAGVGTGKSWWKINYLLKHAFTKLKCRKFIGRTPLKVSVSSENKDIEDIRKELERNIENYLGESVDLKLCKTIKEFIDLPLETYAILLVNDGQLLNGKYSYPSKNVRYFMDYMLDVNKELGYEASFLCPDEIAYGGSTETAVVSNNLGNTGGGDKYRAAWISMCIEFAKDVGLCMGMTATYLNEMAGDFSFSNVMPEYLDNPDIFKFATDLEKLPIPSELTYFVNNIDKVIFAESSKMIGAGYKVFNERRKAGIIEAQNLKDSFPELKFKTDQKLFVVCAVNTYAKKKKLQKKSSIPLYIAIDEIKKLYVEDDRSVDGFYFIHCTEAGNYAINSKAKFDDVTGKLLVPSENESEFENYLKIEEEDLIDVLDGKLKEYHDKRLLDIEVIFAMEKLKMAVNIPSINTILMCRERDAQDMGEDKFILVQVEQSIGRAVREYFGIELPRKMCGEEVELYLKEKFGKHQKFPDLMKYVRLMHSYDAVCPDNDIYKALMKKVKEKISAPIELSIFTTDNQIINEQEDCIHCGGTGKEPKANIIEDTNYDGFNEILGIK